MIKAMLGAVMVVALGGCATTTASDGTTTTAVGSGCAANVTAEGYQVACATGNPAKVVKAIKKVNEVRANER